MAAVDHVLEILRTLLARHQLSVDGLSPTASLYAEGLGLDSLQVAELSAMLEQRLGTDPYTAGEFPETVADIVSYFELRRADRR